MQRSDREIAKGGMLISIARIGSAILGFLNTLLLTRFLGGEIYGFYSRILAPSFFLTRSFSGLGEGQALMKYLPFYKSREEEALASKAFLVALEFRLIVGFIFGFLIVVLSPEIASFLNVDSASLVRFNGLLVAFSVVSGILLTTT
ncbi:MAG TPA: hypothetical protein EYP68_05205, partial [Candidatus Korarchaeota archaeon]|nr:hypothetical protein [Candidatus Korarchaeota archaeon]